MSRYYRQRPMGTIGFELLVCTVDLTIQCEDLILSRRSGMRSRVASLDTRSTGLQNCTELVISIFYIIFKIL